MKVRIIQYPKCTTCRRALKWLDDNNVEFDNRDIKLQNPTQAELREWISLSGLEPSKFFNTSGIKYREMNLKEVARRGDINEIVALLATDGMLVKRPIVITDKGSILLGFKPAEWAHCLSEK